MHPESRSHEASKELGRMLFPRIATSYDIEFDRCKRLNLIRKIVVVKKIIFLEPYGGNWNTLQVGNLLNAVIGCKSD